MEAASAAASIIAFVDFAKTMVEMGKEMKASLAGVSGNQKKLLTLAIDLVGSLEQVRDLIQDRQHEISASPLRDSLSTIQLELQEQFDKCRKRMKPRVGLKGAFAAWREKEDIADEIIRLDKKVAWLYREFTAKTSARTQLEILEFRAEMNTRLDQVQAGLQQRVNEAQTDPGKAQNLVRIQNMSHGEMKQALTKASLQLDRESRDSMEKQYLRTKIKTLTDIVSNAPVTPRLDPPALQTISQSTPSRRAKYMKAVFGALSRLTGASSGNRISSVNATPVPAVREPWFFAHYGQTGDPSDDRQDTVMKVLQIMTKLRQQQAQPTMSIEDTAKELHVLSLSLSDLGMYKDALQVSMQAIRIYRDCIDKSKSANHSESAKFEVSLVEALRVAAISAYRLGDFDEALKLGNEAMEVVRKLAEQDPNMRSMLSGILNTFSHYLVTMGHLEEGLKLAEDALSIRRELARERPELYTPDLAESLLNASLCYGEMRRHNEGLEVGREAIDIYRVLAREKPDRFEAPLAGSLHATAKRFMDLERWPEALTCVTEDLEVQRRLVRLRPEVFTLKVAWSLMLAAYCFDNLAQFDNGLEKIQESIAILQAFVQERPTLSTPWLAVAYAIASDALRHLERTTEAIDMAKKSVGLYHDFIKDNPRLIHRDLATAMTVVADYIGPLGCHEEALIANEEIVHIFRALAKSGPMETKRQLAESLIRVSSSYSLVRKADEALLHAEEAVDLCQIIVSSEPSLPHKAILASTLRQCARCYAKIPEKADRAKEAASRSAMLYQELADNEPATYGAEAIAAQAYLGTL